MNRLNYFNPYSSKSESHEDQLTRAYLVVLKHSFHAFSTFFEYCKNKHVVLPEKDEKAFSLIELSEECWELDTQRANPIIETNWVMSILITDSNLHTTKQIKAVQRNARYDGIITFGRNLTMIIENKPASYNVWFDQLNPSNENLDKESKIYCNPVVLEWKEIIKHLNSLLNLQTVSGYEKMIIEDFLSFVDAIFPTLNPYDNFSLCKGNETLIYRRINNLLLEIVQNPDRVSYHRSWGYYISVPYNSIRKIGLIYERVNEDWELQLQLIFSDTQNQAWEFYNSNPSIDHLSSKEWWISPNFHFSFMNTNLVWFNSTDANKFIDYWKKNKNEIYQHGIEHIPELVKQLESNGIITYDAKAQKNMNEKIYSKKYSTLNVCPGFGIRFTISGKDAELLDKSGKLGQLLIEKINEGLSVIHWNGNKFLKK